MSHFATIKTEIRDLEALRAACAELELPLLQGTKARGYLNHQLDAEHVIQLKGPYDIAITREQNGSYALTCDWWNGHVEKEVGKDYGKLLQLYGVHKATREARKRGCLVTRKQQQDGSIKLTISASAGA